MSVRWRHGDAATRAVVDAWQRGDLPGTELRDNPRRRILLLAPPGSPTLLVKHFRSASGAHRLRERLKALVGRSPAAREAANLAFLHARGVPVPPPLALGRFAEGDWLLVLPYLDGRSLAELAAAPRAERAAALTALGRAVAQLHASGRVHGDLHAGNVIFSAQGPVLLDLQHARTSSARSTQLQDVGDLDYSLWHRLSLADRLRIRRGAFGEDPAALREAGRAAERRALAHGASRTRRALRSGRAFARLRSPWGDGLRLRELAEHDVRAAFAAHDEAMARGDARVLKRDPRSRISRVEAGGREWLVKEVLPRSLLRALADALRGSAARRAWRAGHGLLARRIGAATPLAFAERRRLGIPRAARVAFAWIEAPDATSEAVRAPGATLDALTRLLEQLHRARVDHGDLKANNVLMTAAGPLLVDLDRVRFARRLSDDERLAALAQLNASLPDEVPATARLSRFRRYLRWFPFAAGEAAALSALVDRSLARRHRWTGADCACAELCERAAPANR